MATTPIRQRRRSTRKSGDRRVIRVELKDKMGNPRWATADLIDSSEDGIGISLVAPLPVGDTIHIRGSLGADRPNGPLAVRVSWCAERDGMFFAGLEFADDARSEDGPIDS